MRFYNYRRENSMKIFFYNSRGFLFFFFFRTTFDSMERKRRVYISFHPMDKVTIRDNEMKWKREWKRIK